MTTPFKTCTMCGYSWATREDFISDPLLDLNGYQIDFETLELGLFYFTHTTPDCGSTMALYTRDFLDLYKGEKYEDRRTGKEDCPRYCLEQDQLDRCEAHCECAMAREVINIIKESKHK